MKKCCRFLRKHATKIIYYEKMKMMVLIDDKNESHTNQKI